MNSITVFFALVALIAGASGVPPASKIGLAKIAAIQAASDQASAVNNAARASAQIKQNNIAAQVRAANDAAAQQGAAVNLAIAANAAQAQDAAANQNAAAIQAAIAQNLAARGAAIQQAQVAHQAINAQAVHAVAAQINAANAILAAQANAAAKALTLGQVVIGAPAGVILNSGVGLVGSGWSSPAVVASGSARVVKG